MSLPYARQLRPVTFVASLLGTVVAVTLSCGAPSTTSEDEGGNSGSTSTSTSTSTNSGTSTSTNTSTNTGTNTNTGTDTGTDDGTDTAAGPCVDPVLTGDEDSASAGFSQVTSYGKIYGWAVDKTDLSKFVKVDVYLDGKKGAGGTIAGSATASRNLADGDHACGHGYFLQLASTFCTGVARDAYVYTDGGELLTETPLSARCFSMTDDGRDFFNANVAPKMGACTGCHDDTSYERFFPSFLGHGPNEGGSRANNSLISYPTGGNGHQGGNACGGADGEPCCQFQQWWDVEFPAFKGNPAKTCP